LSRAFQNPEAAGDTLSGESAGSIRNVNPGYPVIGRTENCVNCAIATDATLGGSPASALPSAGPQALTVLENLYGNRFAAPTTSWNIETQMLGAGNGARGIIYGASSSGDVGHVFNVVNQNGVVRLLDGQTGGPASLDGYQYFRLLRTN
jgi:filamentous hemagglutinin